MTRRPLPLARIAGLEPAGRGLTADEAAARRVRYGPNDVLGSAGRPWRDLARDTAKDPMLWFLVGTGALYALLGDRFEAATLFAALAPLVGMDAFLHRRTQASTQGLQRRLAVRATVVRDGAPAGLAAIELVPGDLVLVSAGEAFPADGIVVAGGGPVDESTLTGEAYPVRKQALAALPRDGAEPVVEGVHWGLAGTRLLSGEASVRVTHTGSETLYGAIARSAVGGARARTPLQEAIGRLVGVLLLAASALCLVLAAVRLHQGHGLIDAVVSAATLAVAALPEEFPVVFAFFLGVGVYRLARRQALVRRGVSVENIGRVTAICADKTGTITEGRLALTHLLPADGVGEARLLALAAEAARPESGDPLDVAIARAVAARPAPGASTRPVPLATYPFTEDRRRETAIVRDGDGSMLAVTKGAAELILGLATLSGAERERWTREVSALAAGGHKVIACGWRRVDDPAGEPDRGYRFAGLLALEDPVRAGVAEAVRDCRRAGIEVVMVTGDHPLTARAVAREIGLGADAPSVLTGADLEARLAGGAGALAHVDVIARALPVQKLALVHALQARGEIVAVTGDGVNDVPALTRADVGIAMGERGTQSAREVAAIVLLDDNFRTIVRAIAEGRQLFRNLRLSFAYLLMIHIPLVLTAALIPLAGYPLLYLPIHIVWLELIIHPTALLVFQELPARGWLRPARARRRVRFFSRRDWVVIVVVGTLLTLLVTAGYVRSLGAGGEVEHARAVALVALTVASAALTAALSGLRTGTARVVAAATAAFSLVLVQTPALAARLHLAPLHLDDLALASAGSLLSVLLPLGLARALPGRAAAARPAAPGPWHTDTHPVGRSER